MCFSSQRRAGGTGGKEEGGGGNDFQQAGWSSMLPRRIPQVAESGWPVFGSWSFLIAGLVGLGPVLAVCLSAVSQTKHQT